MRQAEQTSWIVSFEVWQQKRVRDLVRCIGYVFGWLNLLGLTNAIYYVASEFSDPLFAKITGSYVQVCNGTRAIKPVSFINNVDPAFSVPQSKHRVRLYDAAAFPFDKRECDSNGYHEWVAHFLCLAIKVSYEQRSIIHEVVDSHAGWKFLASFETLQQNTAAGQFQLGKTVLQQRRNRERQGLRRSCSQNKSRNQQEYSAGVAAKLIPDTNAFLMTNDNAVVLFFRGTEPAKLVEWWSDAHLDLVSEEGVIHGAVHAGFYEALFYPLTAEFSIFQKICSAVVEALQGNEKKLYITGHSLGGALTSVFCHAIASLSSEAQERHPNFPQLSPEVHVTVEGVESLLSRIGGVYSFAGPLAGDRQFVAFMVDMYGPDASGHRKMFRINHSSDIVPKVPPPILGYRHHPLEYFLSFDGFMYCDPQDIELWKLREELWFTRMFFAKLCNNWTTFAPDGENVMGANRTWIKFRRCAWHTVLRLYFWTGGFFTLLALQGVLCRVPDHWPSDYEVKLRVMAKEFQIYKQLPANKRDTATTHLWSRTRFENANVNVAPEDLLLFCFRLSN